MKLPKVGFIASFALIFGLSFSGASSANGFLGIGDCKSINSKIYSLESKVIRDLNYIYGLSGIAPSVNSAQGVKVYERYQSVASNLKAIQVSGKSKPKCFNLKQKGALGNPIRWSVNSYVGLGVLSERYWISSDLKYEPLRNLK